MKKLFMILLITGSVYGQTESRNAMPSVRGIMQQSEVVAAMLPMMPLAVLDHFAKHHPERRSYWGYTSSGYTARYVTEDGLTHVVIYDRNGGIIREEHQLAPLCIPAATREYIRKRWPGKQVQVWSCQEGPVVTYYAKYNLRIHWFDSDGSYDGWSANFTGSKKTYM